jgi:DNA-directed RNA polymerase alpha subunit
MEMRMKRGRGYVSADKNFDEDLGIGWIPIDSVHSPIKKVNYLVEAARLGQTTDYDKLTVDVWTNGSISARDAVSLAAKLIRDHLNIFINLEESASRRRGGQRPAARRRQQREPRQERRGARARRSVRTTASRTRTSGRFASWCRRPKPRCSRRRISAARA